MKRVRPAANVSENEKPVDDSRLGSSHCSDANHTPDWVNVDMELWVVMLADIAMQVSQHHESDVPIRVNEKDGLVQMPLDHFKKQLEFGQMATAVWFGIVNGVDAFREKYGCDP